MKKITKDSQQCKPIEWTKAKKALDKLEKAGNYNAWLLLTVGFYTGLRIGDILSLKYGDFNNDSLTITEQKTGKTRNIPIVQTLHNVIATCKASNKANDTIFLFTNSRYKANKPITTAAAITRIRETLEFCGFSESKNGNLSAHTMRKTFALRYFELMQDEVGEYRALSELAKQLNHANTDVTRRYICLDIQTVTNVFANFD